MEIKRRKQPKRLKRKQLRGGFIWDTILSDIEKNINDAKNTLNEQTTGLVKNINDIKDQVILNINSSIVSFKEGDIYKSFDENQIKNFDNWVAFIQRYVKNNCESEKECNAEELAYSPLSNEDAADQAKNIIERFLTQKKNKKLTPVGKQQDQKTEVQKKIELIDKFDIILLKILALVSIYFGEHKKTTNECSPPFRNMISLLRALPNIDNNLIKLVDENITDFQRRYNIILDLLKDQCKGFMVYGCSLAASALGPEIKAVYTDLKNKGDNNIPINHDTLIEFIHNIIPIMIKNLSGIKEFENELIELNNILLDLKDLKGGKKSSRAIHKPTKLTKKVILGKERCIYKVQGSKKEHVKYKGSLIPVADFKKLMKV